MIDYEAELSAMLLGVDDADGIVPAEVANLRGEHGYDGLAACWHYIAEESMPVGEAIGFTTQRFKGFFPDVGEFAKDLYTGGDEHNGALGDATARLPYTDVIEFADYIDWDDIGYALVDNHKIETIMVSSGSYVFDIEDL